MTRQDSVHRRQALEKDRKISFLGRELSAQSFYADQDADMVVPCVTQDEEDEVPKPSTTPQSSDHSFHDDTATDIWTDDASLGEDSRSESFTFKEELESRKDEPQHNEEEKYCIETYLNNYETMLQRQEDENVATLAHLMPMLQVLEVLVTGKTAARISNRDSAYFDPKILLKEFKLPELKRACKRLNEDNTYFDFIRTDQQFMLVLKLLTETSMASRSVSWAEIAHCYKICISGMQALGDIPAGKMRNQIKERTISSLQGLTVPKVPSSILKKKSKPTGITSVTTSSSSATISPLAHSVAKNNFQAEPDADPMVVKMKETHESAVKEINLLKLTISFLLGLMISIMTISHSNASTSSSIDILLEQVLEARAVAAEASVSVAMTSDDSITAIGSRPQDLHLPIESKGLDTSLPDIEEDSHVDIVVSSQGGH